MPSRAALVVLLLLGLAAAQQGPSVAVAGDARAIAFYYVLPTSGPSPAQAYNVTPLFVNIREALQAYDLNHSQQLHLVLFPGFYTGPNNTNFAIPENTTVRAAFPTEMPRPIGDIGSPGSGGIRNRPTIDCENGGQRGFTLVEVSAAVSGIVVRRCGGMTVVGGATFSAGSRPQLIQFTDVSFLDNSGIIGGAVAMVGDSRRYVFVRCVFENNRAEKQGAAIYQIGGESLFRECHMSRGVAAQGAGIGIRAGSIQLVDTHIFNNTAKWYTGMIGDGSNVVFTRGSFRDNIATQDDGGAAALGNGQFLFDGVLFLRNSASDDGGAFAVESPGSGRQAFINCSFVNNTTVEMGGALYLKEIAVDVINCTFSGNRAGMQGGGIAFLKAGTFLASGLVFDQNFAADQGGGMVLEGTVTMRSCVFTGNKATNAGGGVCITKLAKGTITKTVINGNWARLGGGLSNEGGKMSFSGGSLAANSARLGGGAYLDAKSSGMFNGTVFSANSADDGGGGIYQLVGSSVKLLGLKKSLNVAPYGADVASDPIAIVLLASPNATSNSPVSLLSRQPQKEIRLWVRVLDNWQQQIAKLEGVSITLESLPMLVSKDEASITQSIIIPSAMGQFQATISAVGKFGDTVPLLFTLQTTPKLNTTLLLAFEPCLSTEIIAPYIDAEGVTPFEVCVSPPVLELIEVSVGVTIALTLVGSLLIIMCFVSMALVWWQRKNPIFKAASPPFLIFFLFWCAVLSASGIAFAFTPTHAACGFRLWFLCMGAVGVLVVLFSRTWRLYKIFFSAGQSLKVSVFTSQKLFGFVCLLLSAEVVVLCVWMGVATPEPTPLVVSENYYILTCGEHLPSAWPYIFSTLALIAALNVFGMFLAFQIRNLQAQFNESRFIVLSVYVICALLLVFVPMVALLGGTPDTLALLVALGAFIAVFSLIIFLIGQKCFMWRYPDTIDSSRHSPTVLHSSMPPQAVSGARAESNKKTDECASPIMSPISSSLSSPVATPRCSQSALAGATAVAATAAQSGGSSTRGSFACTG